MMMRFAGGVTVAGILGFIIVEALKILMVPITVWAMGLLVMALKILLISLAGLTALGVGIFFYKRAQQVGKDF
ncbi:MAG: hypothetical protein OXU33_07920 [Gemmatimonadota bacterium]|nr:hypothetical protein [Gemmatimonadota bacterium]MDE3004675.1 hypothetical protein [Gemmatimonadota bacterium]MDE3013985.1 hypothetical protein [Gemmatimonadota bacterium]